MVRIDALVLASAVAATVMGCSKAGSGPAPSDGESYSVVRFKDGRVSQVHLGPGKIPPEFPPDMPLYPGAEFTSTGRSAKSVVVLLSTGDPIDAVFAFYRQQQGYEELSEADVDDMRVLHLKHTASGKDVQVVAKVSGQHTQVSLVALLQ